MTDDQYNELIQRLDRIIEILHKETAPKAQSMPAPILAAQLIWEDHHKPITIDMPYEWAGTCMECAKGTCKKDYSHT